MQRIGYFKDLHNSLQLIEINKDSFFFCIKEPLKYVIYSSIDLPQISKLARENGALFSKRSKIKSATFGTF